MEVLRTETFRKERERFEEFISSNGTGYLKMTVQREKDVTLVSHECARKIAAESWKMRCIVVSDLSWKIGQRHRCTFDLGICNVQRLSRESSLFDGEMDSYGNR